MTVNVSTEQGFKYLISSEEVSVVAQTRKISNRVVSSQIVKGTGEIIPIEFNTDPEATYKINVSYAFVTLSDEEFMSGSSNAVGNTEKEEDLSTYDGNLSIEYDSSSKAFIVSGFSSGAQTVRVGTATEDGLMSDSYPVPVSSDESVIIESASFLEPLQHGYFYAFITSDSGNEVKSNGSVRFIEPLTEEIVDITERWQTAELSWKAGAGVVIDTAESTVECIDVSGSVIQRNPNKGEISATLTSNGVSFANLDSNTSYNVKINFVMNDNFTYPYTTTIKTKSFAGTYKWSAGAAGDNNGKCSNFVIDVTNGTYGTFYTINVNENDCQYKNGGKNYRLLPLVEGDVSSPIPFDTPVDSEPYGAANEAYNWNYIKWCNTTGESFKEMLKSWTPEVRANYKDYVLTSVLTNLSLDFLGSQRTNTSFEFREVNQKPQITFINKGDEQEGGLVSIGLFGEEYNYTFVLSLVEEAN